MVIFALPRKKGRKKERKKLKERKMSIDSFQALPSSLLCWPEKNNNIVWNRVEFHVIALLLHDLTMHKWCGDALMTK